MMDREPGLTAVAMLAVALASMEVYGVMSYSVALALGRMPESSSSA